MLSAILIEYGTHAGVNRWRITHGRQTVATAICPYPVITTPPEPYYGSRKVALLCSICRNKTLFDPAYFIYLTCIIIVETI